MSFVKMAWKPYRSGRSRMPLTAQQAELPTILMGVTSCLLPHFVSQILRLLNACEQLPTAKPTLSSDYGLYR